MTALSLSFSLSRPVPFSVISFFVFFLQPTVKQKSSVFLTSFLSSLSFPSSPLFHRPVCQAISFKSVTFDVKWRGPESLQPLTHKNTHAHGGLDVEGKVRSTLRGPNHPLSLSGSLTQSHLIECVCVSVCVRNVITGVT